MTVRIGSASFGLATLLSVLILAGCGADKQESVSVNMDTFASPDGNIGCIADQEMVRCDIRKKTWKAKPDPDCELDYGNGILLADGPAEFVCAGDTTMSDGPELVPGTVNMVGTFECATNEWGDSIRCENMNTGNGFELSADEYEFF